MDAPGGILLKDLEDMLLGMTSLIAPDSLEQKEGPKDLLIRLESLRWMPTFISDRDSKRAKTTCDSWSSTLEACTS